MTVQELQQLFYLNRLIDHEKERLEDLRNTLALQSPALTDMPKAPGARDKIGDVVPAIVDQEEEIENALLQYQEQRERLQRYIDSVPFPKIKLIMILRFIQQKTWQEVANAIGGKETEYSVKHTCYRYVEGRNEPS